MTQEELKARIAQGESSTLQLKLQWSDNDKITKELVAFANSRGYYAWGETSTKSRYDWSNYFDCLDHGFRIYEKGSQTRITPSSGHDTARENWGGTWRMPTDAENDELCKKCKWTYGHNGYVVTGPNGNSIFLPAAGYSDDTGSWCVGLGGSYWSSTLSSWNSYLARYLNLVSSCHETRDGDRRIGQSVRPVTE